MSEKYNLDSPYQPLMDEVDELLTWVENQNGGSPANYADDAIDLLYRCRRVLDHIDTLDGALSSLVTERKRLYQKLAEEEYGDSDEYH